MPSVAANTRQIVASRSPVGARYGCASSGRRGRRRGQLRAIELAVRGDRQRGERDERRRHHELRQHLAERARAARGGAAAPDRSARRTRRAACRADLRCGRAPRTLATPGCAPSRASISPSSMRKPRSLTWLSARPRKSIVPSARQRTRSPVRYSRAPAPNAIRDEALGGRARAARDSRARRRARR